MKTVKSKAKRVIISWVKTMKRVTQMKLGRCRYCMRWSTRGTIAAWGTVALFSFAWPDPITLIPAIFVAVSFTVLTAMHSAVFAVRVVKETPETSGWGRRQFLAGLFSVGAMAFISSFAFAILPRSVLAQGNSLCVRLCKALFPPGRARGKCISEGARGHGICVEGPCVPAPDPAEGFKPKTDLQTKLAELLENNPIPSTLAGSFFRLTHRFNLGRAPANELEASVFGMLDGLSPEVQAVLGCGLQRFDAVPLEDRLRLFGPEFAELDDEPVSVDKLAPLVADELMQRASLAAVGDADCGTERPGQRRFTGDSDGVPFFENFIWRLKRPKGGGVDDWLHTAAYRLAPGEPPFTLTPDEIEQQCTIDAAGQRNCENQTTNCPGQFLNGVCLRVPNVAPGNPILLEGMNFFDVNARVVLSAKPPGVVKRRVDDVHVCGDITTPVIEIVDKLEHVIQDSRVKDVLSFTVPKDLPDGIYEVNVIVPNTPGSLFPEFETRGIRPLIRVIQAATDCFQIASVQLRCVEETDSFLGFGSDEVGIRILTAPIHRVILADGTETSVPGKMDAPKNFRFGDVDSGDTRDMAMVLFQRSKIAGVTMNIIGHEIDNNKAYEEMITELTDVYMLMLTSTWNKALNVLLTIVGAQVWPKAWGGAVVGAALGQLADYVIVGVVTIVSGAAPDLIIEDAKAGLDGTELAELTSPNFPNPSVRMFTSAGKIKVTVTPVDKVTGQYRERRRYRSDGEDSTYEITLRYNRFSEEQCAT